MTSGGLTAEAAEHAEQNRARHAAPTSRRSALSALSAVNPLALFFGPIFQKEVRTAGRKRWGYIGRAAYAAALLAVVALVMWGMWADFSGGGSSVQRLQQMQQMAPGLAITIVWFQFIILGLFAPTITGPAIADEKRARTLSTLLTTPLTAGQIVGSKLAGRLVQIVILALLALPLMLAVRVFGGLEAHLVLQATAVSLSTAILGASLGLLFSVWNSRATTAAVFGVLTLAMMQGAPAAVEGMLTYWLEDRGYAFHEQVLAMCSPATLLYLTRSVFIGMDPPVIDITLSPVTATSAGTVITLGPMWLVNTLYSLALAALFTFLAAVALRRTMQREAAGANPVDPDRPRPGLFRRRPRPMSDVGCGMSDGVHATPPAPDPSSHPTSDIPHPTSPHIPHPTSRRAREVGDNPVLWREVRQPTFGSRRRLAIAAGLAAIGLLFLYYNFGIGEEGVQGSLAVVGAIAVMLQSVFMTTGAFVSEREGRTWEVLLTTPLSGRDIIRGKLAGALRAQWFLPAVVLIHFGISAIAGVIHPVMLLHMLLILAGPMLLFTCTGLLLSLFFKRSTPAAVCNLILAMAFWLLPWVVLGVCAMMLVRGPGDYEWFIERAAGVLAAFNPAATAIFAFEPATRMARGLSTIYEMPGFGRVSLFTFTASLVGVFAVYAGLAAAALWATLRGFKRFSGRVS